MKLLVTGAHGFLGQHLIPLLTHHSLLIPKRIECDWRIQSDVAAYFQGHVPQAVIHLAANVGGIGYNKANSAMLWRDNLAMGLNLLDMCQTYHVKKLVMVSTTCAYPKYCEVPFKESSLWDGYPEETNAPYGIAKRALMVGAEAYRREAKLNVVTAIPTNLYGEHDNFDPDSSHVIPALIRKFLEADGSVEIWGTGKATRDFLYAGDCARGLAVMLEDYNHSDPVNLGSGEEVSIGEIAIKIGKLCGYQGPLKWDASKPDGQPRRLLDTDRAFKHLNWQAKMGLDDGLKRTVDWWKANRC